MGLFNFKKKEILQNKPIDEINNDELKQNIKKIATEIVAKTHKIDDIENKNIEIRFQYLDRTSEGLQSMFTLSIEGKDYYFNIAKDDFQLLDERAKQFFDI
jgi:hypothetical protein